MSVGRELASGASDSITIVILRGLGYSGATWVNLILGSHREAMAMGPPARILDLPRSQRADACFVHRSACRLWPEFLRSDHRGRFFRDLSGFAGKRVFILNYPPEELVEREITGQGFRVLYLRLVRDGRANLYSYLRHKGMPSPVSAVRDWQIPRWDRLDREMPGEGHVQQRTVRYEDFLESPAAELVSLGRFIGLDYGSNAHRFWEYEHHLAAGNTGVIDLLCRMQSLAGHWHHRSEAYGVAAERLRQAPDEPIIDREWEHELSREARLAFDVMLGERNAAFGYPRDVFTAGETEAFRRRFEQEAEPLRPG